MEAHVDTNADTNAAAEYVGDGCGFGDIFRRRRKNSDEDDEVLKSIEVGKTAAADGKQVEVSGVKVESITEKLSEPPVQEVPDPLSDAVPEPDFPILREYQSNPKYVYNMTHARRGKMIIISNRDFLETSGMAEYPRDGTEVDAEQLKTTFSWLGFECEVHENKTCSQMLSIFINASNSTDYDVDCMAFAILTHGDIDGAIYGTDAILPLASLLSPLKHNANMEKFVGKPKLLFIQACRGHQLDEGVDVADDVVDGDIKRQKIPIEADFLYAYSTAPGYFAFRGTRSGSIFVRRLCEMLHRFWSSLDLVQILTRVNNEIAYYFQSEVSEKHPNYAALNHRKQIPSIVSMLTKDVYFVPKPKKTTTV